MDGLQAARRREVSFVIRLWLEPREQADSPQWRWYVHHVQSGDEAHFHSLRDMLAYVEAKSGVSSPR